LESWRGCPDTKNVSRLHAAVVAAAFAFAALAGGCSLETKGAAHVTANAATLEAKLRCGKRGKRVAHGRAWWQLRRADRREWRRVSPKRRFHCGKQAKRGKQGKRVRFVKRVKGLRAGVRYEFRLVVDPRRRGGKRFHTPLQRFTTDQRRRGRRRAQPKPAPRPLLIAPARGFSPGLVSSSDHQRSAVAAARLGADVVRVEFDVNTPASQLRASVAAFAAHRARVVLLAGFHGRMPTEAEARNLASWAAEFGPGGPFWAGRRDGHLAVRQIEFGNETSYAHQYGDNWSSPSYKARAGLYATRFAQAHAAIAGTGRAVGLLAQGDDGGTGSANWVNAMFDAVPNLGRMVDGWAVHPYGPRGTWKAKLDRLIAQTAARGAPATIPIDITEYGISSNNGIALSDNYGWPVNQTFGQAAAALDETVAGMRADPAIGPRLRLFMLYQAHDLNASLGLNRERFFGALNAALGDKGAFTVEVRQLFMP
jgi:hypothetical protein